MWSVSSVTGLARGPAQCVWSVAVPPVGEEEQAAAADGFDGCPGELVRGRADQAAELTAAAPAAVSWLLSGERRPVKVIVGGGLTVGARRLGGSADRGLQWSMVSAWRWRPPVASRGPSPCFGDNPRAPGPV